MTSVISGVKRADQLADNIAALDLVLSAEEMASLDEVSRLPASYPSWIQSYRVDGRVPQGHPFEGEVWSLPRKPR